jgi:hypothetical protein
MWREAPYWGNFATYKSADTRVALEFTIFLLKCPEMTLLVRQTSYKEGDLPQPLWFVILTPGVAVNKQPCPDYRLHHTLYSLTYVTNCHRRDMSTYLASSYSQSAFDGPIPSFLSSPPILTCCAISPTSFGDTGPHLRRWLVAQPSTVSLLDEVFLIFKANAKRSMHSPR